MQMDANLYWKYSAKLEEIGRGYSTCIEDSARSAQEFVTYHQH